MSKAAEQIARLKGEIRKLEAEEERLRNLTPIQQIAESLHDLDCRANHADGCSWYYESWEEPGWARKRYCAMAEQLMPFVLSPNSLIVLLEKIITVTRTTRVP